jgi:hypothetical protein
MKKLAALILLGVLSLLFAREGEISIGSQMSSSATTKENQVIIYMGKHKVQYGDKADWYDVSSRAYSGTIIKEDDEKITIKTNDRGTSTLLKSEVFAIDDTVINKQAQDIWKKIEGTVTDKDTKKPIADTEVVYLPYGSHARDLVYANTNKNGKFNLPKKGFVAVGGAGTIVAEKKDYIMLEKQYLKKGADTDAIQVELVKKSNLHNYLMTLEGKLIRKIDAGGTRSESITYYFVDSSNKEYPILEGNDEALQYINHKVSIKAYKKSGIQKSTYSRWGAQVADSIFIVEIKSLGKIPEQYTGPTLKSMHNDRYQNEKGETVIIRRVK